MKTVLLLIPCILLLVKMKRDKYFFSPMITFSCGVIAGLSGKHAWAFVCAAYLFSVIGDFFLCHKRIHKDSYLFGITGFFLAHAGFLAYAIANAEMNVLSLGLAALLTACYGVYLVRCLFPALDNVPMRVAVSMYMLISVAVFSCAFSMNLPVFNKVIFILGIFMILFSDTIISFSDFLGCKKWDRLILPTYFLCHILVCASMIL